MTSSGKPIILRRLLLRLWHHLGPRRRTQYAFLMALMLVSTFAEMLSLGAVVPFLGILISPERVFASPYVQDLVWALGVSTPDELVFPLTAGFAVLAILAGSCRLLLLWASTKLAFASGADISAEVYRHTLYQPYEIHVARNSSEVVSGIINRVNGVVFWIILPVLTLVSSMVLLVAITAALVAIDPVVAITAISGFGASYGVITLLTRKRLLANGHCINHEQTQVIKVLQEGLGGIRDVLLDGTQPLYCEIYQRTDGRLRRAFADNNFIGGCPRPSMEALGMGLIAMLAYALSRQDGGIAVALPVLGVLALGAQRLLPALQQSYSAWAYITGGTPALADTIELLDSPIKPELLQPQPVPLPFSDSITFDHVSFRYSKDGPWILDGLGMTIRKGARIGIVGSTGSGKSTALDLLMGLLTPASGTLKVDGKTITGELVRAWQRTIAHVPQSIFLSDSTLAENIAFGVPSDQIDMQRVKGAAASAHIAEFIESRPEGYNAMVGERGIRLSGGQRQRIGIARALYKQASVLIFDEATSALDNVTEQSVMEAIQDLDRDLTVIIVAHRLTTVRHCDSIFEMQDGKVTNSGNFSDLMQQSPTFRQLAQHYT